MTATIKYTSARRHKPDVVGSELAPSMTSTNWTAGNGATLSNDSSGRLKVAYNATANPYAYRAITVVANSFYRVKVSSISDGTAQLPIVQIGTSIGGNQLGEFDFRKTTVTDTAGQVDVPIVAPGTTIYLSLYCAVSSAGYALFDKASVKLVTTLTHAASEMMHDGLAYSAGAYTAVNSTIGIANVFSIANGEDDNAMSVANTGVNSGIAYRTNAFVVVVGRQYKASCVWIPHACSQGVINIGTTSNGENVAIETRDATLGSFFTAGSGLLWEFTNTDDGWSAVNATKTNNATYLTVTASNGDPHLDKSGLSFSGQSKRHVVARLRRTSPGWTDDFGLYYTTASHGRDTSNYQALRQTIALAQNEWTIVVWDMHQLSVGGDDWKNSTITGLSVDFTSTSGGVFDLDYIAVGNLNPIEATFTANQSPLYFRVHNSNESNATSYYAQLSVEQLDSEYTLTPGIYRAEQSYPETVHNQLSINGTEERIFHREEEIWNVTTKVIDGTDALADYLEFISSVKAGETFTIDLYGDSNTKTAKFIPGSQSVERVDSTKYRVSFGYRVQT